jgi:hypothetical protein
MQGQSHPIAAVRLRWSGEYRSHMPWGKGSIDFIRPDVTPHQMQGQHPGFECLYLASESGRRFWIARLRPARPRHPKSHPCCVSRHSGPRPLQQQRPRTRLPDAYAASHSPILSNPFVASVYASCGQVLGDFIARPKEDLIRGLPLECGVRHHFVVCGDVKLGESTKIGEAVQRIEGIAKSASEIARMPRSSNWKT